MMSELHDILLRVLAFTDRSVTATLLPDASQIRAEFASTSAAKESFKTFKSAIFQVQGASFAGMKLDGAVLELTPQAFAPFESALAALLADMENLYLLTLAVLEPRFAASPAHRLAITRERDRRNLSFSLRFPDTVSHVLLGNWFKVHDFGALLTLSLDGQHSRVQLRVTEDLSELLAEAATSSLFEHLSFRLAMGQGVRVVSHNWHDARLNAESVVLEVAGTASDELADGVVVLSDMAKFYDYLTVEMDAAAGRDFRYEAVNDEKTTYGVIVTQEFVQHLRQNWLNQLYLEYLLSLSPALGYFERFRIERTRHVDDRYAHGYYAVSSHEPSAIMLAHAFLRKEMGLDVGENYFEESGRYWLEVDEDDLTGNVSFYKSAHLYQAWFSPLLRTIWSIPGISRVRMKRGWLRIRCNQETFSALSGLEGAVVPRITPNSSGLRGFGYRIFFSPWALQKNAATFEALADQASPPPQQPGLSAQNAA